MWRWAGWLWGAVLLARTVCAADFPFPLDTPEQHGMNREALDRWRDRLAELHTRALLVIRGDRIVYEWYAAGEDGDKKQGTASLAKALVGGSSLMLALEDHRLQIDDPAARYIPYWRGVPGKGAITIRELATHTSGIEDAEQDGIGHMQLPGWKGAFWRRDPDPFSVAVRQAPVIFPPGTSYAYSNPGMAALAYAVTASLKGAAQSDIRELLRVRLFEPLGIPESHWSIGYGQAYPVDGMQLYATWGGGAFTPRAAARIGQLMLHQGEWNGKRLIGRVLAQRMTSYAGMPVQARTPANPGPASGLCWWVNYDGVWPDVPRDAFAGAGAGQELLLVVPSLDLIVVRNGALMGDAEGFWRDAVDEVFRPAVRLAASRPPYPPSAVIRGVSFAAESGIVRRAVDSDNWPITWGDDDAQYTAYGDGRGFEPQVANKLSLGLAKVSGGPGDFQGVNLRSRTGERTGDGAQGAKASGLLMVDGVLYMWVRNTSNAQLAWSPDHGRTWQWGFRVHRGFRIAGLPELRAELRRGARRLRLRLFAGRRVRVRIERRPGAGAGSERAHTRSGCLGVPGARGRGRTAAVDAENWRTRRGVPVRGALPARGRGLQSAAQTLPAGTRIQSPGRLGNLRRTRTLGSVDDRVSHRLLGAGRHPRLPFARQVDRPREKPDDPVIFRCGAAGCDLRCVLCTGYDARVSEVTLIVSLLTTTALWGILSELEEMTNDRQKSRFEMPHWCGLTEVPYTGGRLDLRFLPGK